MDAKTEIKELAKLLFKRIDSDNLSEDKLNKVKRTMHALHTQMNRWDANMETSWGLDDNLENKADTIVSAKNKLSDKILIVAEWLENSENELLSEASEEHLDSLALSLVHAADTLREAATEIQTSEPVAEPVITAEKLEELAAVAASFDESGDELLQKQAAVLDDILLTLSAPKNYNFNFKKAEDDKLEVLKKKYKEPKEELDENIGTKEALDALKKSPTHKDYRPLEAPLSTRTCLDHPGAQMARIADNTWQCSLDHKVYNYDTGFTTLHGDKVPGGSVSEQTPKFNPEGHQIFDDRDARLGIHRE